MKFKEITRKITIPGHWKFKGLIPKYVRKRIRIIKLSNNKKLMKYNY